MVDDRATAEVVVVFDTEAVITVVGIAAGHTVDLAVTGMDTTMTAMAGTGVTVTVVVSEMSRGAMVTTDPTTGTTASCSPPLSCRSRKLVISNPPSISMMESHVTKPIPISATPACAAPSTLAKAPSVSQTTTSRTAISASSPRAMLLAAAQSSFRRRVTKLFRRLPQSVLKGHSVDVR